ncbi:MAG: hypothetical protein JWQ11_620 [Rhizobacter sp.]|nr:hypothetical protein [Rhizobacter sp.]
MSDTPNFSDVSDSAHRVLDSAMNTADQAADLAASTLARSKKAAAGAYDSINENVRRTKDRLQPMASQFADDAQTMARTSLEAARRRSMQVRDAAADAASYTTDYVKERPVKSLLIAAAAGIAVYGIARAINRARYGS